ncbi:hypothetical protein TD95_000450 [Thielaviopsis punctulata]|uniref:Phosphatidylinositol-specific phospholipase C X domain-containing protein n=1 Tax=Thielaviopsis punctulata TaxID=72032 RepID=A0A0F4ZI74_9PEZI|nr:hypothetical protein TD95_000450 [Thielaviopsis punctulata]
MKQPWRHTALLLCLMQTLAPFVAAADTTTETASSTESTTTSRSSSSSGSSSGSSKTSSKTSSESPASVTTLRGTKTYEPTTVPSNAYSDYTSQITLTYSSGTSSNATASTSHSVTFTGSLEPSTTMAGNATMTSSATPTNTQPCNNYVELCTRRYSDVTEIGCHNSPFVRKGSSAANQQLPVRDQLNDGVRFLQAQMQWPADAATSSDVEPHFCHTSCDILDAGPVSDWLGEVRAWVDAHPYDVVTILIGNGNYSNPDMFAKYFEATGITKYAYLPPLFPMKRSDWPTLGEMIVAGKRVVMFLDYEADQAKYPWLLQEFSQMWETPFDPEDRSFPCTVNRPPNLSDADAKDRLYLVNHNLNVEYSLFGASILVPAVTLLNQTNNNEGNGSLGMTAANCYKQWGVLPKVLNVDFYNIGGEYDSGAVFKVAAAMNNVTYNRTCCGKVPSAASRRQEIAGLAAGVGTVVSLALAFGIL